MLESIDDSEEQERGVACCLHRILPLQEVQGVSVKVLELRVARLKVGNPRPEDCFAGHGTRHGMQSGL